MAPNNLHEKRLMDRIEKLEPALRKLAEQAISVLDANALLLEDDAGAVKLHDMAVAAIKL